ncbi:MAG: phosphate regulon sensor histidine kinase PhoR [Gammaproteobacteria bacterium]|nr:phosphate regulon sensor histidine kinase PhoR [Gammaproteobacteria bacterium]
MKNDIWKFAIILALAGVLGLSIGYPLQMLLTAALGIVAWQIHRINLLYKWVRHPKRNPLPDTSGQIQLLHFELNRRIKINRKRKRLLSDYLGQFRQAVLALPDAIVLIDESGKIQWANRNADQLLGIHWPADRDLRFSDLIRNTRISEMLAQKLPVESSANQPSAASTGIEFSLDHSRQRTINIKVIRYSEKLRMVVARDVSRLVRVNRMHRDFVANVSHELKTPLTVLRGYLEILQGLSHRDNSDLSNRIANPIDQMSMQSERMQLLVNDLLYLSRLEDSDVRAPYVPIDVTLLVNNILESVNSGVAQRHHKLDLDIDYQLQLLGNHTELHSAFSNLLINAINYTDENGVITVRWLNGDDGGACFSVSDNGHGIPAHHIPRLTERFYRIDDDRSREGGGTGLGLAIVKHVLQRHEARLEIDSKVDRGSTFSCVFPGARVQRLALAGEHSDQA